ncbi:uncharacterized protein LOC135208347 [Macrobrachium nipponense]|uniref:uncharacterized protein LOC135208347 n=1 Tax=Macrobrachium nipponense TaxID=159736 RepID=UPI0030C88D22
MLCEGVDESSGDPFLDGTVHFFRKAAPKTPSVLPEGKMGSEVPRPVGLLPSHRKDKGGSPLVVGPTKTQPRLVSSCAQPSPSVIFRCLGVGLGSNSRCERSVRHLERRTGALAHQQKGVGSSSSGPPSLRVSGHRIGVASERRQHHSPSLHQEAGRNTFLLPLRESKGVASMDQGKEHHSPHQVHPRRKECEGRSSQQKRPSPSHGMDSPSRSVQQTVEPLGKTKPRPVCDPLECKTGELLLTNFRPKGSSSRRSSSGLVGNRRVRFSPFQDLMRSSEEVCLSGRSKTNSDRPFLASSRLVHRGTGMDGGFSEASTQERSSQTAPLRQISQKPPRSQSDCLQTVEGLVRARVFSRKAAKAIARARRPSTLRVYQSKWEVFRRWSRAQMVSSSSTSVTDMADFFLYFREKCKLAAFTIKGYRSMLSSVFRHRGLNISEDRGLHDLIRSFETAKTKTARPPSWNLDVVLRFLMSSKFEPPHTAPFRDLTRKSLFLFALASAKRISELQALEGKVGFKKDSAICSFKPLFLAKNENPSKPWPRTFEVMGLSSIAGRELERTLCPVRSLKFYLERKRQLGGNTKSLWCSVRDPKRAISKNAQAFFIKDVIKEAHFSCDDEHLELLRVKAHERVLCGRRGGALWPLQTVVGSHPESLSSSLQIAVSSHPEN